MMHEPTSSFLLIFRDASPDVYKALSPEQRQQLLGRWNAWYDRLAREGKLRHGHPLEHTGRIVTAGPNGRITDGPFVESKEAIGGYFFLEAASLEEATACARLCPSLSYGIVVEVRPVADFCPVLRPQPSEKQTAVAV